MAPEEDASVERRWLGSTETARRVGVAPRICRAVSALATLLLMLSAPVPASAQAAGTQLSRWDVSGMGGLFIGRPIETSDQRQYDRAYNTGTLAITAGRYLTRHLK